MRNMRDLVVDSNRRIRRILNANGGYVSAFDSEIPEEENKQMKSRSAQKLVAMNRLAAADIDVPKALLFLRETKHKSKAFVYH